MWDHQKQCENFYDSYVKSMVRSELTGHCVPLAEEIAAFWNDMTGHDVEFNYYLGHFYLYIDMGKKMSDGKFPDKGYHVGQLLEFIEDRLYWRLDRRVARRESVDKYDQNFSWEGWSDFPSWAVHVSHGGNCKLVVKDRKMVESLTYETVCED